MTCTIFSASVLSISVLLSACGGSSDGGASNNLFIGTGGPNDTSVDKEDSTDTSIDSGSSNETSSVLSFDGVKPTEVSINEKLEDVIELVYLLEDEQTVSYMGSLELPNSNINVTGNILVDLGTYRNERVAIGDTTLSLNLNANHLIGSAKNFVVSDVNSSGTIQNDDATMTVDRILYTTTGELFASGKVDSSGVASFGYEGRLFVYENNAYIYTVTIESDGVGGFLSVDGERMFMGALTSNVTADTDPDLGVYGANTIVWAK